MVVDDNATNRRILVIDDLFGRSVESGINFERRSLCAQYLLLDKTGDEDSAQALKVQQPVAEAVFCRGQSPAQARIGDFVRNDLEGSLELLAKGTSGDSPWALVLLDLCFYTGRVTAASDQTAHGIAAVDDVGVLLCEQCALRVEYALEVRIPFAVDRVGQRERAANGRVQPSYADVCRGQQQAQVAEADALEHGVSSAAGTRSNQRASPPGFEH